MFLPKEVEGLEIQLYFRAPNMRSRAFGINAFAKKHRDHFLGTAIMPEEDVLNGGAEALGKVAAEAVRQLLEDMDSIAGVRCTCGQAYQVTGYGALRTLEKDLNAETRHPCPTRLGTMGLGREAPVVRWPETRNLARG